MGFEHEALDRAAAVLQQARHAAGLAAYHYFFHDDSSAARDTYLSALEAEADAQLLLESLSGENG